ncbi:MAG: hypothetical protein WCO02_00090 [Bacteroidota bacterium]
MKTQILLFATVCIATMSSFAQFSFIHISDIHVSSTPSPNSDTNAQYFQCAIKEFAKLSPKPAFVSVGPPLRSCSATGLHEANNASHHCFSQSRQ